MKSIKIIVKRVKYFYYGIYYVTPLVLNIIIICFHGNSACQIVWNVYINKKKHIICIFYTYITFL